MHNASAPQAAHRATPPRIALDTHHRCMWAVEILVHGRAHGFTWKGWALDSIDAKAQALDRARTDWRGHQFAVLSVYQVGV